MRFAVALPWWGYALAFAAALVFAWLAYARVAVHLSLSTRALLTTLRALTLNAATLAGAADRLGSLERGKIANVVITEGDLFDDKAVIKHVFVNGRPVRLPEGK